MLRHPKKALMILLLGSNLWKKLSTICGNFSYNIGIKNQGGGRPSYRGALPHSFELPYAPISLKSEEKKTPVRSLLRPSFT